jgi:hypothetical protein
LFLGAQGRAGRFVETFHLKLQLLADVLRQVRACVQRQQLPFLNLAADSFRVKFEPVGARLPLFWTARCAVVKSSDAFALPVESGEFRYFIRPRAGGTSVYSPEGLDRSLQGSASVRLRKVLPPEQGRTVLEGTLIAQERLPASPRDLLWVRLPLPSGRVDLYGHLYAAEGLAPGEARFRTLPQAWPATTLKALSAAEGAAFAQVPFEIVALFSSPADLYALGVLAVRALLVNALTTLPVALDEALSMARQAAAEGPADAPLGQRIAALMAKEPRYLNSLGPHRLVHEAVEPAQALQLLPAELWADALATLVRLFPGASPASLCRDYGDAPALALETVFDQPLQEIERLLERSRSLIVIDWNYNREVRAVIQSVLDRQTVR